MTSKDFCEGQKHSLSKGLLIALSNEQNIKSGFQLYQQYLKTFVLTEADTNIISHQRRPQLEEEACTVFYKQNHSDTPAFFDFYNFNVNCLAKSLYLLKILYS